MFLFRQGQRVAGNVASIIFLLCASVLTKPDRNPESHMRGCAGNSSHTLDWQRASTDSFFNTETRRRPSQIAKHRCCLYFYSFPSIRGKAAPVLLSDISCLTSDV
jgi:hypothetical protein